MAAFIKSLDRKHLVTVGLEGFYGTTEKSGVNPGDWATSLGSDFIKNSAIEHIDFASVHAYPDSWSVYVAHDIVLCLRKCGILGPSHSLVMQTLDLMEPTPCIDHSPKLTQIGRP